MFTAQFDRARSAGLHSVPHAGETTGPETIWDALHSLHAERIEHGIAAVQDERLLEHLVGHGIALDVCPTSMSPCGGARAGRASDPASWWMPG